MKHGGHRVKRNALKAPTPSDPAFIPEMSNVTQMTHFSDPDPCFDTMLFSNTARPSLRALKRG